MKTGNAILGVFCFWMAFTFPVKAIELITTLNLESVIPFSTGIAGLIVFAFFNTMGTIALLCGRAKTDTQTKTHVKREKEPSKEELRKITSDEKTEDLFD